MMSLPAATLARNTHTEGGKVDNSAQALSRAHVAGQSVGICL